MFCKRDAELSFRNRIPMEHMRLKPKKRRSIRLQDYNYAQPGIYFVTLCTFENLALLGEISNGVMILNEAGGMIERWWNKIPEKFSCVQLDAHVIMPDHLHGIVSIVGADPCVRPGRKPATDSGAHTGAPLHKIIQWFKTMTTNEYIRGAKELKWPSFNKHIWQRSFYEHVVRRTDKMDRIREYILNNPLRWEFDRENLETLSPDF